MPTITDKPGTATQPQIKLLVANARKRGLSVEDLRGMAGVERLHDLSRRQASYWLKQFGVKLANPPGEKPKPYKGKPRGTRMIQEDHVEQINRLGLEYFGDQDHFANWLERTFAVREAQKLSTARLAGLCVRVLRDMLDRKGCVNHKP